MYISNFVLKSLFINVYRLLIFCLETEMSMIGSGIFGSNSFYPTCWTKLLDYCNVKSGSHQPLLNQPVLGSYGSSNIFAKEEDYGISIHWTNNVADIDGTSDELIQYSYIALKQDAMEWLIKNG